MTEKLTRTNVAALPRKPIVEAANGSLGFHVLPFASEVLKQSFALRYQVYCEELDFLPQDDYPANEESDEFDAGSVHVGALNLDERVIASVRMVPSTRGLFPMENHCEMDSVMVSEHLDISLDELRESSAVEISRLVVDPGYRRRRGDTRYALSPGRGRTVGGQTDKPPTEEGPTIALGLYQALYQTSKVMGVRYWLAAMEPVLTNCLARYGMKFVAVGPVADYYGPVQPYAIDVESILEFMRQVAPARARAWAEPAPGLQSQFLTSATMH